MEPATISAAITMGRLCVAAGADVYAAFRSLVRQIPGLDAEAIDREIHRVDTSKADGQVDSDIGRLDQ